MGIDWNNQALDAVALLTSPHPLERIQGRVLQILRSDDSSTKTGDQLFIELSQPLISELLQEQLSFLVGETLTSTSTLVLEQIVALYVEPFISQTPAIEIIQTSPTDLKVTITCQ